jgi:cold shock CspA family protein
MKADLRSGQLTKWKDERGFGFIQPVDGSKEVFLHISELNDATRRPKIGDTIYDYIVVEDGKVRACNAFILGARGKPISSFSINKNKSNAVITASKATFPIFEVLLLSVVPLIGAIHLAWTQVI